MAALDLARRRPSGETADALGSMREVVTAATSASLHELEAEAEAAADADPIAALELRRPSEEERARAIVNAATWRAGDLAPDVLAWDGLTLAPFAELEAEAEEAAAADPIARHELAYLTPERIAGAATTRRNLAAQEAEATRPLTPEEQVSYLAIVEAERVRLGLPTLAETLDELYPIPDRRTAAGVTTAPEPAAEPPTLIVNIDDYRASVPSAIPWVVAHLAYIGGVSLISGPPKAGKSTLAAQIQRNRETGERLFGVWDITTGPTLLVTEEGGVAVVYKTEGMHSLDVLDRRSAIQAGLTFAQVLAAVGEWGATHPGGLAFIDTLAIWAGIENENAAGETTKAIAAVTAVAQAANLAIVLVHHARKGGGDDGEAVRGSGAILATVDIGIELSRVSPGSDERYLDVMGRVCLAERYRLDFDRSTMTYSLIDQAGSRLAEIEADLVGIPADGPGLDRNDLHALWKKDPRARAKQLVNTGRMRVECVKSGRQWANHYWSIPPAWTPEARRED